MKPAIVLIANRTCWSKPRVALCASTIEANALSASGDASTICTADLSASIAALIAPDWASMAARAEWSAGGAGNGAPEWVPTLRYHVNLLYFSGLPDRT